MDKRIFFAAVREAEGPLTQQQVDGYNRYLAEAFRRDTPLDKLAYIMATGYWETGRTMYPVEEGFYLGDKAAAFRRRLRYYPWHGRGDVQLTWEDNYARASNETGVDLIANPEKAMDPEVSVKIIFAGMEEGWFTGKKLDDYLDGVDENDKEDLREFANARRIVNGTDKQIQIGKLAIMFEKALRAAEYGTVIDLVPVDKTPPRLPAPAPETKKVDVKEDTDKVVVGDKEVKVAASHLDPRIFNKALQGIIGAGVMYLVGRGIVPGDIASGLTANVVELLMAFLGAGIGPSIGPANRVAPPKK